MPFVNDFSKTVPTLFGSRPRHVSDMGFPQIGYQTFKLLAYQRLHEMARHWEERYPGVDIVLIEPEPDDELMFQTSIMNFAKRVDIARHGFESVTLKLAEDYDHFKEVCERHGIEISATRVRKVVKHFAAEQGAAPRRLAQDPRADDRRAAAPVGSATSDRAQRSPSALERLRSAAQQAVGAPARLWTAARTCVVVAERPRPAATSTARRSRRCGELGAVEAWARAARGRWPGSGRRRPAGRAARRAGAGARTATRAARRRTTGARGVRSASSAPACGELADAERRARGARAAARCPAPPSA